MIWPRRLERHNLLGVLLPHPRQIGFIGGAIHNTLHHVDRAGSAEMRPHAAAKLFFAHQSRSDKKGLAPSDTPDRSHHSGILIANEAFNAKPKPLLSSRGGLNGVPQSFQSGLFVFHTAI